MKTNMYKWMDGLASSGKRKALPVMTYPGLDLIGKTVMDVISSGKEQFQCINALAERYPTEAAVIIMDLSVEAEAFGSRIKFSENEVPTVVGKIISGMEDAEKLKIPKAGDGRTSVYLEVAKIAAGNIESKPVLAGHIGPFSLAGRLMDMTEIMISMMEEPEIVHIVLEKCTSFLVEYCKAFKAAGANGVIIAEPAAGLLPPDKSVEFSSNYVKRIVDAVQDETFVVILHNCGNTVKLVDSMVSTGAKGLHFGNAVKMTDIMPQVPADRIAFGNVDPAGVFKNGTVEEMTERVGKLLEEMKPYRNYVLSSGCDVPPGTSLDNVNAFYGALEKFNREQ